MARVAIVGEEFHIDGRPTYPGRTYEGHNTVQGLLFNVRAVQATFDDANPSTRHLWAYPDTGVWGMPTWMPVPSLRYLKLDLRFNRPAA